MPIDLATAVGAELPAREFSWTRDDVVLYHLAIGAGSDPTSPRELRYAGERDLEVLPTFALLAPAFRLYEPPALTLPGIEVDLASVLHGGQTLKVCRPLPVAGRGSVRSRVAAVHDKWSAAVIQLDSEAVDESEQPLFTARTTIFARGEGGFGGERGTPSRGVAPSGPPDVDVTTATLPQQALLYRLCGDRNPLHSDPAFARTAGFPRPILHGLCTYGIACKALVDAVLDGRPERVRGFSARFSGVVYPGEPVRTRAWRDSGSASDDWAFSVTVPGRDDAPALSDGRLTVD